MNKSILALILIGRATVEIKRLQELQDEGTTKADQIENEIFKDLEEIYNYEEDQQFVHYNLKATAEERFQKLIEVLIEFYGL